MVACATMADRPRLRGLVAPGGCRTPHCELPAASSRGHCASCEAVYDAVHVLRDRLLDRRRAHVRARHADVLDGLSPGHRERLIAHLVAHGEQGPAAGLDALDDFLDELRDLGLTGFEVP